MGVEELPALFIAGDGERVNLDLDDDVITVMQDNPNSVLK